jgi:hypothetical protein
MHEQTEHATPRRSLSVAGARVCFCVEVSRLKSQIVSIHLLDPLKVTTSLALTRAWPARLPGQTANVFPKFGIIFTELRV